MATKIDPESFRFSKNIRPTLVIKPTIGRYKPTLGEKFLCGPVSLNWLSTAACLPGKGLHVGVLLWFQSGMEKKRELKFNQSKWKKFGLSRDAARRGLAALERAELVNVIRHAGRKPIVTILLNDRTLGRKSNDEKMVAHEGT